MKKAILVLGVLALVSISISKNSFANEYEVLTDTIFDYPHTICIDPGHGGLGASKYRNIQGRILSTCLSTFPKDNLVKISINGKKTLDNPELLDYTFIDSKYI
jgi:DNA-binding protein YbaB